MKYRIPPTILLLILLIFSCSHDKIALPEIPEAEDQFGNVGQQVYVAINPPLDAANGFSFNQPSDIYLGADNFLYVCDTGNDRIVMLDVGGDVQGVSQTIPHPESVTQNDSLHLLIVNKTNAVFKIDLVAVGHDIGSAPVERVFEQSSKPNRQFNGISAHAGYEYYVTVLDPDDSSSVTKEFSFVYDFTREHTLKGPLPFFPNGTGLFSTIYPTSVVSIRERWLDVSASQEVSPALFFTHIGRTSQLEQNNFKVQHITTVIQDGSIMLAPNIGLVGEDIYSLDLRSNLEDVALDRSGFVFVVDAGGSGTEPGFYRFSSTGRLQQSVIGLGDGDQQFNNPKGIAVLPFLEQQVVFVADTGNNRIVRFRLSTDL